MENGDIFRIILPCSFNRVVLSRKPLSRYDISSFLWVRNSAAGFFGSIGLHLCGKLEFSEVFLTEQMFAMHSKAGRTVGF